MSVLLYILSANLDSIGVGISYGARKIHITRTSLIIIVLFTIICSAFSLFLGSLLSTFFSPAVSDYLGKTVMICLGIWILLSAFKVNVTEKTEHTFFIRPLGITISIMRDPTFCDFDDSSRIEWRESLYLALAMSLDSVSIGLGLGISNLYRWYFPLIIGASQFVFLEAGRITGSLLADKLKIPHNLWTFLAGICLILLAIFA